MGPSSPPVSSFSGPADTSSIPETSTASTIAGAAVGTRSLADCVDGGRPRLPARLFSRAGFFGGPDLRTGSKSSSLPISLAWKLLTRTTVVSLRGLWLCRLPLLCRLRALCRSLSRSRRSFDRYFDDMMTTPRPRCVTARRQANRPGRWLQANRPGGQHLGKSMCPPGRRLHGDAAHWTPLVRPGASLVPSPRSLLRC